jgi:adhesin transport system outer membrane protein
MFVTAPVAAQDGAAPDETGSIVSVEKSRTAAPFRISVNLLPMFGDRGSVATPVALTGSGDALTGVLDFMIARASPPYPAQGREAFIQAIRAAVASHPAIGAAMADVGFQGAAAREAYAGFLPTVSGQGDFGYKRSGSSEASGTSRKGSTAPGLGLTLRQLVYDFGATSSAYDAALSRQTQSKADLAASRSDYAMRAISAHVDVLRMRSHQTLAERNKAARRALFDQMRERARSGGGSEAEVTRAESRYVEAEANAFTVSNRLLAAESGFAEIFGFDPPKVLPMPFDPPMRDADRPLPDLLKAYAPAQSRDAARNAAERDAEASKSRGLPRESVEMSYSRREYDTTTGSRMGNDATVGLALRYDFYNGGADAARAEQAAQRAGRAALEYELVRRQFEHSLAQARADVKSTADMVDARIRSAKAAVRSMEAVNEQFQFNRGSLLDAIKTQEELYAAGKDMIDALAERFLARFRLIYFTSQLEDLFQLASITAAVPGGALPPPETARDTARDGAPDRAPVRVRKDAR